MAILSKLSAQGFSIWPFDEILPPVIVEIYPRLLTGPVKKTLAPERAAYRERHFPELSGESLQAVEGSEDAFDAAVSALVMSRHVDELLRPVAAPHHSDQL
jgi:hypothetical protein